MRWYQMLGLLAVVLAVALIGWLKTAKGTSGTAASPVAIHPATMCEDCSLPAKPAGTTAGDPYGLISLLAATRAPISPSGGG